MARTSARSQNLGVTFCSSEVRWDEDFFVVFLAAAAALEFGERGGLEFWSTLLRFLPANAWGERVGSDGESDAPVFPARVDRRSGDIVESSNTSPRGRGRARRAPGDPASFPAAAGSGFNMLRRARGFSVGDLKTWLNRTFEEFFRRVFSSPPAAAGKNSVGATEEFFVAARLRKN